MIAQRPASRVARAISNRAIPRRKESNSLWETFRGLVGNLSLKNQKVLTYQAGDPYGRG
jgi:hypothetical protein